MAEVLFVVNLLSVPTFTLATAGFLAILAPGGSFLASLGVAAAAGVGYTAAAVGEGGWRLEYNKVH
jgi:hypothetical protein